MPNDYYFRTDIILAANGGKGPLCHCGERKVPQDDHGRFICFECDGLFPGTGRTIPQINTSGMTDKEKAKIVPINRLDDTPTESELSFMQLMLKGTENPEIFDSKEYTDACNAIEAEREGS